MYLQLSPQWGEDHGKGPKSDEIIERNGEVHCRTEGEQGIEEIMEQTIEQTIEQPTERWTTRSKC